MFNLFKKKKKPIENIEENDDEQKVYIDEDEIKKRKKKPTEYNFWLIEEIKKCGEFDKDLTKYITPSTHPLHAKWIANCLINEVSEANVAKLARIRYDNGGLVDNTDNISDFVNKDLKDENGEVSDEWFEKNSRVITHIDNEVELINFYEKALTEPDLKHFLKYYKPDKIYESPGDSKGYEGAILGNIIGSKYEFIAHEKLDYILDDENHFTADTVLTAATYFAIKENKNNPDFRKWYIKMAKKYENAGYDPGFYNWAFEKGKSNTKGYDSFGSGSAARVSPIGYLYDDINDVIEKAFKSAIVTHNHINGVKGAVVSAVVCWMCKCGYRKEDIKKYVEKHYAYTKKQREYITNGKYIFNMVDLDDNVFNTDYSLYCDYAVPFSFCCFLISENFNECMKYVLSYFCDTDTVCAIAGGFAYGYYNCSNEEIIEKYLDDNLKKILA